MTYQEALSKKNNLVSIQMMHETTIRLTVYVVPEDPIEFKNYIKHIYKVFPAINDELAIQFSMTGQFILKAIGRVDDTNLAFKEV